MTKPDLMAELAEVVRLCDEASAMLPGPQGSEAIKLAETAATNWVITHHAELEAAVRDAARYRFLRMGDSSAGVSPAVYESRSNYPIGTAMLCFDVLDEAMDEAMHNSAREG